MQLRGIDAPSLPKALGCDWSRLNLWDDANLGDPPIDLRKFERRSKEIRGF